MPSPSESGPIMPVSAGPENFVPPLTGSPVTTAAYQVESFVAPLTAAPALGVARPAQNPGPMLNIGPPVVTPPAQPVFLAPSGPPPPPCSRSQRPGARLNREARLGLVQLLDRGTAQHSGDQFDMPLNQVGQ